MGTGFEHAPLALFTTLTPMAAASFIVLAYAFIAGKPDEATAKRLDRWTALPAVVMAAGMIAAMFHLANPAHAMFVFSGLGTSPLSNELAVTVAFALVALVYWILGLAGKLPAHGGLRSGFLIVLACGSVILALACGAAYMMNTIPTWDTPYSLLQMLGYALLGGAALGALVCALAKASLPSNASLVIAAIGALGVVLSLIGLVAQAAGLDAIANIWGSAAGLVPALNTMIGIFAVCGVVACILLFLGYRRTPKATGNAVAATASWTSLGAIVLAAVGIFVARIAFYGLFMGIAL